MSDPVAILRDPTFWRRLAPALTVDGDDAGAPVAFDAATVDTLRARVCREGFFQLRGVFDPLETRLLLAAILALRQRGLPPVFVFGFAEPWRLYTRLGPLWSALLGPDWKLLPALWAWYVEPGEANAGWPPHQDRKGRCTVADGGLPLSMTCWIPLTPADPTNGCMYVVPMQHQPIDLAALQLQDVRALPAMPGDVLGWNGNVFHWGGRSTPDARFPRVSLSMEMQRADQPPYTQPMLDNTRVPSFPERLWLIGRAIGFYDHMESQSDAVRLIGRALAEGEAPPG